MKIVVSNNDDEMRGAELDRDIERIFDGMRHPELERATIDAIREYRASVVLAETVRLELIAAEAGSDCSRERRAELQLAHKHADTEYRARQLVLNKIGDRLGYVSKVPTE